MNIGRAIWDISIVVVQVYNISSFLTCLLLHAQSWDCAARSSVFALFTRILLSQSRQHWASDSCCSKLLKKLWSNAVTALIMHCVCTFKRNRVYIFPRWKACCPGHPSTSLHNLLQSLKLVAPRSSDGNVQPPSRLPPAYPPSVDCMLRYSGASSIHKLISVCRRLWG